MRVVIIGGKGLIGSAVADQAKKNGHQVLVLTRGLPTEGESDCAQWDGRDAPRLIQLIDGKDAVINLAGESIGKGRWTFSRKAHLLASRIEPARALVEALSKCEKPPRTLIQASAIGFYGIGGELKTESSEGGNDYLADFAAKWEKATDQVEALGIRRVIIRSGVVLDSLSGVLQQLKLPFRLLVGGQIGSGDQVYSWIHIQDEAAAILHLMENSSCQGVYNLTAPEPVTNSEMGRALAKAMRRPYWLPVPAFALRLVLGEMSTLVLDGQRVFPERLLQAGFKFQYPTIEAALKDLI